LALEIISGRLPCAAGVRSPRDGSPRPFVGAAPKSLFAPVIALPASEVRKNLRRDHSSMGRPSSVCAGQYTTLTPSVCVHRLVISSLLGCHPESSDRSMLFFCPKTHRPLA